MRQPPETNEHKRMGLVMQVLAWLAFLGLGVSFFGGHLERQFNPNQQLETRIAGDGVREVVLQRNRFGHYVTSGSINGMPVTFLLDTGATGVAIPEAVARALNLERGRPVRTQTANGIAISYAVTLHRVSIGGIELDSVSATISPVLQTDEVLLGMSFLRHIEFSQRGDTLILRQ